MPAPEFVSIAGVEAVLFDYGLVLCGPPDQQAWQQMLEIFKGRTSVEAPRFHSAYWRFREEYDAGRLTGEAYWHAVAEELGSTLAATNLADLLALDITLWTQPNRPMLAWAQALQAAGLRTGILSNLGDRMEAGVRAAVPLLGDFTHHTFSHRVGITKPIPAIYEHAAHGLGVPAPKILFVDDRAENISAALAAGMQAVHYGEHQRFLHDVEAAGLGALLHPAPRA